MSEVKFTPEDLARLPLSDSDRQRALAIFLDEFPHLRETYDHGGSATREHICFEAVKFCMQRGCESQPDKYEQDLHGRFRRKA